MIIEVGGLLQLAKKPRTMRQRALRVFDEKTDGRTYLLHEAVIYGPFVPFGENE